MYQGSLIQNSIEQLKALFENQSIRYDNVSDGAKALRVYITPILIATVAYLPICWALKAYYKDRSPFPYRMPVIGWNFLLAFFSALGSVTMLIAQPDVFLHKADPAGEFLCSHGWLGSFGRVNSIGISPICRIVVRAFCITKILEYGDTFLLCIKKRPTIFLHLYHHITVALYCLHAVTLDAPFGHFFAFVNLNIHAVMYSYYAAAIVFKGNKLLVAMRPFITLSQLTQMFFGIGICIHELNSADRTIGLEINAFLGLSMYISYAYLFGDFFVKNYKKALMSINVLCAASPMFFLPICLYSCGMISAANGFLPASATAASVAIASMALKKSPMSYISPIEYYGANGHENATARGVACLVKTGEEDTYRNMADVTARYFTLPVLAVLFDSIYCTTIALRTLPGIFIFQIAHAYVSGAFETSTTKKETEEEKKEVAETVKVALAPVEKEIPIRRTSPQVCR